jgi:hypothetical protein
VSVRERAIRFFLVPLQGDYHIHRGGVDQKKRSPMARKL